MISKEKKYLTFTCDTMNSVYFARSLIPGATPTNISPFALAASWASA